MGVAKQAPGREDPEQGVSGSEAPRESGGAWAAGSPGIAEGPAKLPQQLRVTPQLKGGVQRRDPSTSPLLKPYFQALFPGTPLPVLLPFEVPCPGACCVPRLPAGPGAAQNPARSQLGLCWRKQPLGPASGVRRCSLSLLEAAWLWNPGLGAGAVSST